MMALMEQSGEVRDLVSKILDKIPDEVLESILLIQRHTLLSAASGNVLTLALAHAIAYD